MASADGYKQYTQEHSFGYTPGTVIAPSSNRSGSARVLRVGCSYGTRTVAFDATRVGMPPVLPAAEDTPGDTFVGGTVTLPLPIPDTRQAGYTFRGYGQYVYLQDTLRIPGTDPLPTGSYPFSSTADMAAASRLQNGPGGAAAYAAAVAGANPNQSLLVFAGEGFYDDDNPQEGWYLTGFPSQAFTVDTISG